MGKAKDVYLALEPLYNDFRKLRFRDADAKYVIRHMDEFISEMLSTDFLLDVTLPFLQRREVSLSLSLYRFPISACSPPSATQFCCHLACCPSPSVTENLSSVIPELLFTLTQSPSLALIVMTRSEEFKTSRSILMLILSDSPSVTVVLCSPGNGGYRAAATAHKCTGGRDR